MKNVISIRRSYKSRGMSLQKVLDIINQLESDMYFKYGICRISSTPTSRKYGCDNGPAAGINVTITFATVLDINVELPFMLMSFSDTIRDEIDKVLNNNGLGLVQGNK